jgi:hypothetical protein
MIRRKMRGIANVSTAVLLLTIAFHGLAIAGGGGWGNHGRGGNQVPELDPYTIGAGLTVFGGAAALVIERYRRRKR